MDFGAAVGAVETDRVRLHEHVGGGRAEHQVCLAKMMIAIKL